MDLQHMYRMSLGRNVDDVMSWVSRFLLFAVVAAFSCGLPQGQAGISVWSLTRATAEQYLP